MPAHSALYPAEPGGQTARAVTTSDLYLMSPPARSWALRGRANFRSREAGEVNALAARKEWLRLARAIERLGGTVAALVPTDETLTGMPYAAEAGHVLAPARGGSGKQRFLLPRMKAEHRKRERDHWAPFATRLGFELLEPKDGIWEAQGDVATFDGTTLLFHGGRTDRAGVAAALPHFEGEVMVLEIREPAFHGNMAVAPLPAADKLMVCPDVIVGDGLSRLAERFGGDRLIPLSLPEILAYATNGLAVGERWLAPSIVPERVKRIVSELEMQVVELPMLELCEKAGGASRCLVSVAPGAASSVEIPPEARLDAVAESIANDPA
jgi:N-dimethylarginine dimethylaminohydrolase